MPERLEKNRHSLLQDLPILEDDATLQEKLTPCDEEHGSMG